MLKRVFYFMIISSAIIFADSNSTISDKNSTKVQKSAISAKEAAFELFKVMKQEVGSKRAVDYATKRLVIANKNFKTIEPKIRAFYKKYIGWSAVKDDLAKLYTKYYTKEDLVNLTNFYKTKTGQKVLATMGKLSYEGQVLIQKKVEQHVSELKKILDSVAKKSTSKSKDKEKK